MGYLLIPILICLVIAYAMACVWKTPLSYTIPSTVLGIDLILFLLYLLGMVKAGTWVIVAVAIIALGYIIYCAKIKEMAKIDLPIVLFLLGLIAVSVYCYGNIVREWDSLRLWGGYPKALYYTGKVQLGVSSWIGEHERTYIPGMPLLVYFFESFFPAFREDVIYVVYAFLHMSFFLPALGKAKKPMMLLGLPIMLLAPILFFSSYDTDYYEILYIDPILGMALGYLVYLMSVWDAEDGKSTCNLLLAMCGVVLLKDIGLFFAIIVLLGCMITLMKRHMLFKAANVIYFAPILLYFLWGIVASLYGGNSQIALFNSDSLFNREEIRRFLHYISHANLVNTLHPRVNPYCTVVNFLIFFTICAVGLYMIMRQIDVKMNYKKSFYSMMAVQIGYLVCLYVSVLSVDKTYMSTYRYESSLILGFFVFILLVFLDNSTAIMTYIWKRKIWIGCIVGACLCIMVTIPPKCPQALESPQFESAERATTQIRNLLSGTVEDPVRICVLLDGDDNDSLMIQRTYFNLIGEVYIPIYASITLVDDTRDQSESIAILLDRVETYSCDYVFTLDNAEILSRYNDLFENEPKNYTLYELKQEGENVILQEMQNLSEST